MARGVWLGLIGVVWASGAVAANEGLAGHWQFDTAGAQVQDISGMGHSGAVIGGKVIAENGRRFLRLDGRARVEIPSAPDLNLGRGFTIEARIRPTELTEGRIVVFKDQEYMLRVDSPKEAGQLSFFVNLGGQWEPRVSAFKLPIGAWYHVVAVWNGTQSQLWVNGMLHQNTRNGEVPPPTTNPVEIGSPGGYGAGFVGDIEYVKVYNRALRTSEIINAAYGIGENSSASAATATRFDFRRGTQGWAPRDGANSFASEAGLVVQTATPTSSVLHDHLRVSVANRDFLSLRMAVDRGTRAQVVFATTEGAGRIALPTYADGAMHTYIVEPWQSIGWGGQLIALGIAPSDREQARACIEYVRLSNAPRGAGEIKIQSLFPEAALPRVGRPEVIVARVQNGGGPAANVRLTLRVPRGVRLSGPAEQTIAAIGYQEQKEVSWPVHVTSALSGVFRVEASGEGIAPASLIARIAFLPGVHLPKASYVPEPVPVQTGKYEIWTHYCPLWKQGTHIGWQAIEPYPERKPVLGWYNEGSPEVADWHIKDWLEHGISGVIYCWYRSNVNGPVTQSLGHAIHDGLLEARYLPKIKFGIMWENGGRKGVGSREDLMENVLPFWLDNYFTHPSYLKVDGKPVLYVWIPQNLSRQLGGGDHVRETFDAMREKCRQRGLAGLYIVGCVGSADQETLQQMAKEGWDASSAYGNGWLQPEHVSTVGDFVCAPVQGFVEQQERIWKGKTALNLLPDITAAMMGWDSRPWNETPFFWSDNTPETFRDLCQRAKAAMDAKTTTGLEKSTAIFCCWNEFGEGHYIEPTRGYGFSYLDVIREVFTDAPRDHADLAPEDVGLGPYDSWYQQARAAAPTSEVFDATSWSGADLAAWTDFGGPEGWEVDQTAMRMVSVTDDPAVWSPPLKVRANRFTRVIADMRVSEPGDAQLFWSTPSMPRASEGASVRVKTIADGRFHRYAFDVAGSEYWGGCVTSLRLDPAAAARVTVEIRAVELQ